MRSARTALGWRRPALAARFACLTDDGKVVRARRTGRRSLVVSRPMANGLRPPGAVDRYACGNCLTEPRDRHRDRLGPLTRAAFLNTETSSFPAGDATALRCGESRWSASREPHMPIGRLLSMALCGEEPDRHRRQRQRGPHVEFANGRPVDRFVGHTGSVAARRSTPRAARSSRQLGDDDPRLEGRGGRQTEDGRGGEARSAGEVNARTAIRGSQPRLTVGVLEPPRGNDASHAAITASRGTGR